MTSLTAEVPIAPARRKRGLLLMIGGNISKPITGETSCTLSCVDEGGATLTKTATVHIIPTFQEI